MTAIARLAAVSLDTSDPAQLADFYRQLLDLEVVLETEEFIALKGAAVLLTMQRVADHRAPEWPSGGVPKQIHLELSVDDLDEAEAQAVAIGAVKTGDQPSPELWRVLLDPAGHPFCITTLIPAPERVDGAMAGAREERLEIRVIPRARRDEIGGERAGRLVVRVMAAPVDDQANLAVRRLVAEHLGVRIGQVEIIGGRHSRDKSVRIRR